MTYQSINENWSAGVKVMSHLSNTHTNKFGIPTPVVVPQNKVERKSYFSFWTWFRFLWKIIDCNRR